MKIWHASQKTRKEQIRNAKKRALDAIGKKYGNGCVAAKTTGTHLPPILRRPMERKVFELKERLKQRGLSLAERKELRLKLIEMKYGRK